MPVKILLVTATSSEADVLIKLPGIDGAGDRFLFEDCDISVLVTGIGAVATAWALTKRLSVIEKPDLVLNAGIAGCFGNVLKPGDVVMPVSDCFADLGVDTGKGFINLFEAGLDDPDRFPFRGGFLEPDNRFEPPVTVISVRGVTVNATTGTESASMRLTEKYKPDIETMEGAAFFYICAMENLPFMALRSISNRVGPRDLNKWDIPLALNNLAITIKELFLNLH